MEIVKEFKVRLVMNQKVFVLALAAFFLCWHPGFIGSETLQLTTYYPAPYGGYVSILTTGNTTLARDSGRVGVGLSNPSEKFQVNGNAKVNSNVYWGSYRGRLTTDQGASIELGGRGTPYIDFSRNTSEDYSGRLMLTSANRMKIYRDLEIDRDMYVNRDLYVSGYFRNFCTRRRYLPGATVYCPSGYRLIGFYGDGVARVSGFLPRTATSSSVGKYIVLGEDWGGTMVCCRIPS